MPTASTDRDALLAILEFQVAAGVDIALDERPHDRFAESTGAAAAARPPVAAPARREQELAIPRREPGSALPPPRPATLPFAATSSTEEVATDARMRAAGARSLEELRDLVAAFDGCALKASARQLVFHDGNPAARLMVLGEAPGAEEDRSGVPFVGRGGQLLDRMMGAIGLDRTGFYVANIVPWRPPGNRTPTPQEVATCLPFTLRQIELAGAEIVVTLGAPATQMLLGVKEGIFRTRGRWVDQHVGAKALRVLPMLHPAFLLRQPLHKRLAWRDLLLLRRELDRSREPAR